MNGLILSGLLILAAVGCAGPQYFLAPGFTGEKFTAGGVAILPVMVGETGAAGGAAEGYRRSCGEQLAAALRKLQPTLKVVTPSEVSAILAKEGLVDDYSQLSSTYQMTGILDTDIAAKLALSTVSKYLLVMKIQSLFSPKGGEAQAMLLGQIWDSGSAEMSFEASTEYTDSNLILGGMKAPPYEGAIQRATDIFVKRLSVVYTAK